MHYIRHMWNATSKSSVEPKSNFPDCFSRRFDKVLFNLKLSNSVDSDVPSKSNYLSNEIRHMWKSTIELGNVNSVNTGRYADTHRIFYIPVNFAFNLPHYVTSYMHHTGKKESKKETF